MGQPPVPVFVHGRDAVLRDGVVAQIRETHDVVDVSAPDAAAVVVLAADRLDRVVLDLTRRVRDRAQRPVVLVVSHLDDESLIDGVAAGASAFLRRADAVPDRLGPVVLAAAQGFASVPPDLVQGLLSEVNRHAGTADGPALSAREAEVLRLASEGLETSEIARRLAYSERTVKGVIHGVTTRFDLRNRTHAVAYAMRLGLI
jgi:DNA-binding NarL/FixJ family response regulator